MFKEYVADLRARGCAERTARDMLIRLDAYLGEWKSLSIAEIKRSMARERHRVITEDHGPVVANHALGDFKTCYGFALRVVDDPDALPDNPGLAVTWNSTRSSQKVLQPKDLAGWWEKVQALPNPIRKTMHELGLFSGLRPGPLMTLQHEWVDLEHRAIRIPRKHMKAWRSFDLPLSKHVTEFVRRALTLGEMTYPDAPWLFPSRNQKREVTATAERNLPGQTGHILRHTYRTLAKRFGIDGTDAKLLLDHKVPGIDGVYLHEKALFDRLLAAQERMSKEIWNLLELSPSA